MCTSLFVRNLGLFFLLGVVSSTQAQTWTTARGASSFNRIDDIHFVDISLAFACSGSGEILRSDDGGLTWDLSFFRSDTYFRSIDFVDDLRGFCSALDGSLLATTDGGATWENITNRLPPNTPGFCGISHFQDTVFAAGIFSSPAVFGRSVDRGLTWEVHSLDSLADGFSEVAFVNARTGFLAGTQTDGAVLLRTDDGGDSWRVVFETDRDLEFVWKLFMLDEQRMYASIESFLDTTYTAFSTDGGLTWQEQFVSPIGLDIQGVGFITPDSGWVMPRFSPGFLTTDGGITWTRDLDAPVNVNRMVRRADGVLFAAGDEISYRGSGVSSVARTPIPRRESRVTMLNNPVHNRLELELQLPQSANYLLDVLNSQGQWVGAIAGGRRGAGSYHFTSDLLLQQPVGTYYVTLRADDVFSATPFVWAGV